MLLIEIHNRLESFSFQYCVYDVRLCILRCYVLLVLSLLPYSHISLSTFLLQVVCILRNSIRISYYVYCNLYLARKTSVLAVYNRCLYAYEIYLFPLPTPRISTICIGSRIATQVSPIAGISFKRVSRDFILAHTYS